MNKKISQLLVVIAISLFGGLFFCSHQVFAAAWFGSGPGSSGPGCTGRDCGSGAGWDIYNAGVSWIYYAPVEPGRANHVWEARGQYDGIDFTPNTGVGSVPSPRISDVDLCPNGFWHFGWNAQGREAYRYGVDIPAFFLNPENTIWQGGWFSYSTRVGGWGHVGTYNWGYYTSHGIPYKTHGDGELDHCLYSNGDKVFCAKHYSASDAECSDETKCVWTAFKNAKAEAGQPVDGRSPGSFDNGVYAFCASGGPHATVNYHLDEGACYGKHGTQTTQTRTSEIDKDEDGRVSVENILDDLKAQGFTEDHRGGDLGSIIEENDSSFTINVSDDKSKTIDIYLTKPGDCDPQCNDWTPSDYKNSDVWNAKTTVLIGVQNKTLDGINTNGEWHHNGNEISTLKNGFIYAKPTDDIQWKYCYYPGVERAANEDVTKPDNTDPPHNDPMNPTTNHVDYQQYHLAISDSRWTGKFTAQTHNLKPSADVTCNGQIIGIGNDWPVTGTLPGCKNNPQTYDTQPSPQPSLHTNAQDRLDPGTSLIGDIKTTNGPTSVRRYIYGANPHTWNCNWHQTGSVCTAQDEEGNCIASRPTYDYDTCSHDGPLYYHNESFQSATDDATVRVPYNFKNYALAKIVTSDDGNSDNDIVYAGETVQVEDPQVVVDTRENTNTNGTYATQIESDVARARLIAFISGPETGGYQWGDVYENDVYNNSINEGDGGRVWRNSSDNPCGAVVAKNGICEYLESVDNTSLNKDANMEGAAYHFNIDTGDKETKIGESGSDGWYNVFDKAAGNYFCVAAAIYPFSVKGNTEEGMDRNGDQSWYVSEPSCIKIAKRPTFQVWGAGIYSAGNVSTSVSNKNNILSTFAMPSSDDSFDQRWGAKGGAETTFGSWSELTVSVGGTAKNNIISGAATGHRDAAITGSYSPWSNNDFIQLGLISPDGLAVGRGRLIGQKPRGSSYCSRSPLSLANVNCNQQYIGNFSDDSLRNGIISDKNTLIDRLTATTQPLETIDYSIVGQGETRFTMIDDSTTIGSNIEYNTGPYTDVNQIPKYIIYVKGDVNISCDVTRIDAILIADGTINTCAEASTDASSSSYPRYDESNRSHQLVVNGALVTNDLVLGRSYGAATGGNTITPAELVNYDSSIYLWAVRNASAGNSGQLTEAASRELAPRY